MKRIACKIVLLLGLMILFNYVITVVEKEATNSFQYNLPLNTAIVVIYGLLIGIIIGFKNKFVSLKRIGLISIFILLFAVIYLFLILYNPFGYTLILFIVPFWKSLPLWIYFGTLYVNAGDK